MSTHPPTFPSGKPRAQPVPVLPLVIALAMAAVIVITGMVFLVKTVEERRLEMIANAEAKYAATYLGETGDGEGGGMWRLSDGVTYPCRIAGAPVDPTLTCGKYGDEPVVTSRQTERPSPR